MPIIFKPIPNKYFAHTVFLEFIGLLVKDLITLNHNGLLTDIEAVMENETVSLPDSSKAGQIYISFDLNNQTNQNFFKMHKDDLVGDFELVFNFALKLKREKNSNYKAITILNHLIQAFCYNTNSNDLKSIYSKTLNSDFGSLTLKTDLMNNLVISTSESIDENYITKRASISFQIKI